MSISIIAAIAKNGVIGKDNQLPWDIPEDTEHFYSIIRGKPVIMGRKTYESLGKPIKDSENYVLSHNRSLRLPGCIVAHSVQEIINKFVDSPIEVMVIGGAPIYEQFLPYANKMYLTLIDQEFTGDVYFPYWQKEEWLIAGQRDGKSDFYSYKFLIYKKKIR